MLLAAPPYLTTQDLLILVTKGGQVRAVAKHRRSAPKRRRAADSCVSTCPARRLTQPARLAPLREHTPSRARFAESI